MYVNINYNSNDTLKKLVEDENRGRLLKRLGWSLLAMGVFFYLILFLVLSTSEIPSGVLKFISAVGILPFFGAAFGAEQLHHASLLSKKRISVGYRIAAFQLDRGIEGSLTKSPYRPYVYAPNGELIAVLYNQNDVKTLIALHLTGKLTADWVEQHSVQESASIKAKDNQQHKRMVAISAHQEQIARQQAGL